MRGKTRAAATACVAWACLLLAGCGQNYPGPARFPLSGTVKADGELIDVGTISFIPTDGGAQRVSGGAIHEGNYSVPEEKGANAGTYRVEIHWAKKTGRQLVDKETGELYDERKEGLPDRYHKNSELTAEVSASKTNLDFDLPSQ